MATYIFSKIPFGKKKKKNLKELNYPCALTDGNARLLQEEQELLWSGLERRSCREGTAGKGGSCRCSFPDTSHPSQRRACFRNIPMAQQRCLEVALGTSTLASCRGTPKAQCLLLKKRGSILHSREILMRNGVLWKGGPAPPSGAAGASRLLAMSRTWRPSWCVWRLRVPCTVGQGTHSAESPLLARGSVAGVTGGR